MNTFAKVLVVIVLLLSSGFAISQMVLYSKREKWRAQYAEKARQLDRKTTQAEELADRVDELRTDRDQIQKQLQGKVNDLQDDLEARGLRISDLERRNENLQTTANQTRERVTNLEERLDGKDQVVTQLEEKIEELDTSLKDRMAEVEDLNDQLRQRGNKIDQLDKRIAQLQQEKREITQEAEDMESMLAQLEARGIDVGAIQVPVIDAKVVRVDNELGAIVLNKGENSGVKIGFPFTIYRESEFVARVYVMQVHEDFSLARLDKQLAKTEMKVGDEATTRIQ